MYKVYMGGMLYTPVAHINYCRYQAMDNSWLICDEADADAIKVEPRQSEQLDYFARLEGQRAGQFPLVVIEAI